MQSHLLIHAHIHTHIFQYIGQNPVYFVIFLNNILKNFPTEDEKKVKNIAFTLNISIFRIKWNRSSLTQVLTSFSPSHDCGFLNYFPVSHSLFPF